MRVSMLFELAEKQCIHVAQYFGIVCVVCLVQSISSNDINVGSCCGTSYSQLTAYSDDYSTFSRSNPGFPSSQEIMRKAMNMDLVQAMLTKIHSNFYSQVDMVFCQELISIAAKSTCSSKADVVGQGLASRKRALKEVS